MIFMKKTNCLFVIKREEEIQCAQQLQEGNIEGREKIVNGYLLYVAKEILHLPRKYQTLELVYRCCQMLEREVENFDFRQDSENFSHRLSNCLRKTITCYIAERR